MNKQKVQNQITRVYPLVKDIFVSCLVLYLFLSIFMILPAMFGTFVLIGEIELEDIELLEGEEKELVSNFFYYYFLIYPVFIFGLIILFIIFLILFSLKKDESKNE